MRMAIKKGYIIFTDTGTVLTRVIKLFTNKPYNHASIAFDSELKEVYSFGRKTPKNPFIGGFVKEDLTSDLFCNAKCAIYSFEAAECQLEMMKRYIQNIEMKKENYRYNFLGLFGFILKKPIKRKNAFFCSQFVATVLYKGQIMHFHKPLSLIAPSDLEQDSNLQYEFHGNLNEYLNINNERKTRFSFQLRLFGA